MELRIKDYNGAEQLVGGQYKVEWEEFQSVLRSTDVHLKPSDQDKKVGSAIFNPVGTNYHIKLSLIKLRWNHNPSIPREFKFLGKGIDFEKNGVLVEIQFSNYPFLLNNILRSELFYNAESAFHHAKTGCLFLVTKAGKFPSSNSTLYFEQAQHQLDSLHKHATFKIPVRLIGLFPEVGKAINVRWTKYVKPRYSRTVEEEVVRPITPPILKGASNFITVC